MNTFQELCDRMEFQKAAASHPDIKLQVGELGIQIYANSPLQFNIMYGDIFNVNKTKQEFDLQFIKMEKTIVVYIRDSDSKQKREFRLGESPEKLAAGFPDHPRVGKIAACLQAYSANDFKSEANTGVCANPEQKKV